jgi:hypothetical protein
MVPTVRLAEECIKPSPLEGFIGESCWLGTLDTLTVDGDCLVLGVVTLKQSKKITISAHIFLHGFIQMKN